MMDNEAGNKRSVGASITNRISTVNPIESLAGRLLAMNTTLLEIDSRLTTTAEHLLGPIEYPETSSEIQNYGEGSIGNLHRIVDGLCAQVSRLTFTIGYLSQLSE